jgi:RimJ/RimL family protein N-acetyltransferase
MHIQSVTLEGRLARLEPLAERHFAGLCAVGIDGELWRWTVFQVHSEADMRRYVAHALNQQAQGIALPFAILDKHTGEIAGCTRFGNIDMRNRRVEIGWTWLGRRFQRTGLNTEAKLLLLGHAFEVLHCVRVELKTDVLNLQSRAAILRIGAVKEGILRHQMITDAGRLRDTVYFSILADEWPSVKQRLIERLA